MLLKDFAERSKGVLQESMKWAANSVRSHLIHYVLNVQDGSTVTSQHSGLALATESVLSCAGYNKNRSPHGVVYAVFSVYGDYVGQCFLPSYACFLTPHYLEIVVAVVVVALPSSPCLPTCA